MALHLEALAVDAADPTALARFWAGVLGWTTAEDRPGAVTVVPSDPVCVALRFRGVAAPSGASRHHLHVTSTSTDDMAATVQRVLALGGRHLDVGQQPDEEHVVLADPEGNALCVIPPWNRFLADTGRLGEVAGDGGRATVCSGAGRSAGHWCGTRTTRRRSSRRPAARRSRGAAARSRRRTG